MNEVHVNQDMREALSAGVDGELAASELRFLLRRMDHDAELSQAWERYHVIRASLRGSLAPQASPGFAARVQAALDEQGQVLPVRARHRHWLQWSAGGAIAASVAVVTLLVGQPGNDVAPVAVTQDTAQEAQPQVADAAVPQTSTVPSVVPPWLSGDAAGSLSQQASATFGTPFPAGAIRQVAWPADTGYATPVFYRRLPDNRDGSYLLLLDSPQSTETAAPRDATVSAR